MAAAVDIALGQPKNSVERVGDRKMGRKKPLPPFEVEITGLTKGGCGTGTTPDGTPLKVKFAPPGARMKVIPMGKRKGVWSARRDYMVRPPVGYATPRCGSFGLCGGCSLQELSLPHQRAAKHRAGLLDVVSEMGCSLESLKERVNIHPIVGPDSGYEYRNKVELSFGVRRFLSEEDHLAGHPIAGRFLGFHAAGRFDRVAEFDRCWLMGEGMARLANVIRTSVIEASDTPLWDVRSHEGFWRHCLIRRGEATGQHLVGLYTTSASEYAEEVEAVAEALMGCVLPEGQSVVGVIWFNNDGVADVARGEVRRVWGQETLEEHLGGCRFRLSADSFFQTSTQGAELLYATIRDAVGDGYNTLYDLYCGTGSIGLVLSDSAKNIVGVEEVDAAVLDAQLNAAENGISNCTYQTSRMEKALEVLDGCCPEDMLIVDPPRAGLHPKVTARLARMDAPHLVYVACKPGSLGRDAKVLEDGGWRLKDIWAVDLFPQTGHLELVGRFEKSSGQEKHGYPIES